MTALMQNILPKVAELARWLIVVGIAYTLATGILYFVSDPTAAGAAGNVAALPAPNSGELRRPFNVNAVAGKHLFGEASKDAVVAAAPVEVEVTRLPLELHGVFVAEKPKESAAIVAQKNKPGKLYAIGDNVPGNAELIEVNSNHVILRRAGISEKLEFSNLSAGFVADPNDDDEPASTAASSRLTNPLGSDESDASSGESVADRTPRTPREFLEAYRGRLTEDPQGLLSELGVTPVGDNGGYQLGNLASSPYLSQTGLKSGDVILSVNGQSVGNVQQDQLQLNSLLAQGSARLEVQRGSRRFYVTASLK
ncbi:MAG: type II secretion system protein N [Pseudomonadales bacterium]